MIEHAMVTGAQCGSWDAHDPHWIQHLDRHCDGLDADAADALTLVKTLLRLNRAQLTPPEGWTGTFPPGAQVVCHPRVIYALHKVITPAWEDMQRGELGLALPVVTAPQLPDGGWRVVYAENTIRKEGAHHA